MELLLEVTSFSQARSFLEEHTLLDKKSTNDMLLIQLPDIQGLRLVISGT